MRDIYGRALHAGACARRASNVLYCYYLFSFTTKSLYRLPKGGLISEIALESNKKSYKKYHLGLAKTGLNSSVFSISSD